MGGSVSGRFSKVERSVVDVGWWPGQWLRTWFKKPTSTAVCELCDPGQVITDAP